MLKVTAGNVFAHLEYAVIVNKNFYFLCDGRRGSAGCSR